ncbi:MAG: amidohydrolase [Gemmatimonadetes bacterium]|nr:amidohydrolase [Gemmatimonadota bacterium]
MRPFVKDMLPIALAVFAVAPALLSGQEGDARLDSLKEEALGKVQANAKLGQEIVDELYSFGELGMQEFETQKYLTALLEKNGFTVEKGVAGIPSSWIARWGSGKPVIALGSDVDCIPQANQKPGVDWHEAIVPGAPGHGEGHNSGQAVNILAALAVKDLMERDHIPGTLVIWPGIAEEQVVSKAFYVRDGVFKDVDVNLFTHISSNWGMSWGQSGSNALWSVQFKFEGESAHAAGAPWRGRSALDAVMLMATAWEYHREHLQPAARSHYVIIDGGDQPNVVPSSAGIWFYFRERDYERTKAMYDAAVKMAEGAALMTGTQIDTIQTVGSAWSGHFNKVIAEVTYANIKRVGYPDWDEKDIELAKGLQRELGQTERGLPTEIPEMRGPVDLSRSLGGGSDDIGDVSWNMPTVVLRYPANIPGGPGHNWANGIAMATPIAHKGVVAGAKVQALTLLDILMKPQVVADAWDYFRNVQTKDTKYTAFITADDKPATFLNADIMEEYRPLMRPFYYDPSKYDTYLDQLGITYPTVKPKPISQEDGAGTH